MDFSGVRYYKFNRILLIILGLWQDNNPILKQIQRTFFILLFAFSICVQFLEIIKSASDFESVLRILSFTIPCLVFSLKYITFCIKSKDVQKIMEQMECNWIITKCKKEIEILHHYSSIGYLFTIIIASETFLQTCHKIENYAGEMLKLNFGVMFYTFACIFLSTQVLPKLLDVVAPLNESRPCKLLGVAAFIFDDSKHFVAIFIHMTVALLLEVTTIVATETTCLTYMQHCSALFKITSYRIENLAVYDTPVSVKETMLHGNIIDAIINHNKAIEYSEFLIATFGISYFVLIILGISSLSVNMFRFLQATYAGETKEAFAIIIFIICHFCYMFVNNFIAQKATNVSFDIYYATCNLPWYTYPVRLQKMIGLIIQKSMAGNKFKFGPLFEGSLESFTLMMSNSMSYFTVFWSLHH